MKKMIVGVPSRICRRTRFRRSGMWSVLPGEMPCLAVHPGGE